MSPVSGLMPSPNDLTAEKAGELLGVHPRTVKRWINAGELRAYRLGKGGRFMIRRGEIERFLANRGLVTYGPNSGQVEHFIERLQKLDGRQLKAVIERSRKGGQQPSLNPSQRAALNAVLEKEDPRSWAFAASEDVSDRAVSFLQIFGHPNNLRIPPESVEVIRDVGKDIGVALALRPFIGGPTFEVLYAPFAVAIPVNTIEESTI